MEEVAAAAPIQTGETGEEETQNRENAEANGHSSREHALLPNGGVEEHATVPKPQRKSPENKSQETRVEAYEKQYGALQQQRRVVEVYGADGQHRRFAAGTKAGFALDRINRSQAEMSTRYSFITAVKDGEEGIEFGPEAELVSYGDGWKLQAVQELKVLKSDSFGVEAKANDEMKNVSLPVRKDFNPADFYPGGILPEYSPPKDGWAYFWNISTLIGIIFAMLAIWVYLLESQFFLTA